jgi:predicted metalloprotease
MRWRRVKKPRDVIDQRGARPAGGRRGGGLGGLPVPGGLALPGGLGIVGVIVFVAIQVFFSGNGGGFSVPTGFGSGVEAPGQPSPQGIPPAQDPQREIKDFSTYVFIDAQKSWDGTFRRDGEPYQRAQLVLYSDAVNTGGCGSATSAVGPFYCPADRRVYLDLSFYEEMADQLGAPGDFAWAYVIAHEMGHHVQRETGISDTVERLSREDPDDANELSVRLELQADCYAGVWANTVFQQGDLEGGDLDEAFTATEAIGDDRLQEQTTGRIDPDSFTHGTSEQRRTWFTTGYRNGDPAACDTFSVDEP